MLLERVDNGLASRPVERQTLCRPVTASTRPTRVREHYRWPRQIRARQLSISRTSATSSPLRHGKNRVPFVGCKGGRPERRQTGRAKRASRLFLNGSDRKPGSRPLPRARYSRSRSPSPHMSRRNRDYFKSDWLRWCPSRSLSCCDGREKPGEGSMVDDEAQRPLQRLFGCL